MYVGPRAPRQEARAWVRSRRDRGREPGGPGPLILRRVLTLLAVVAATLAGGYGALATFAQTKDLSVGQIRLSVSPGHKGALDVYVPLVDWGARFEAVRLPARLRVDLRTVDRTVVTRVAQGGTLDVATVRKEARDAIAAFLRALIGTTMLAALLFGVLVALAIRSRIGPKLRYTLIAAGVTALATGIALAVLLPPRGTIADPQYYAYGADVPRALEAVASVQRSTQALDQELDAQLVGLARLVALPAQRAELGDLPQITVASDLHNNVLAIPILERTAARGPVFFAGDLTDRGSPLETEIVRRVVRTGRPFVFVSGNHDSDTLERELAKDGAIVLTQDGFPTKVAGLRVAGYSDPFERRSNEDFADRYDKTPDPTQQGMFTDWLITIQDDVDVVMVHEPQLIEPALEALKLAPPSHPLVFIVGHTHESSLTVQPNVTVINGGTVGAGGTGNLAEQGTKIGIARFIYATEPSFQPLAADLVSIDPGTGSATARRERLGG